MKLRYERNVSVRRMAMLFSMTRDEVRAIMEGKGRKRDAEYVARLLREYPEIFD